MLRRLSIVASVVALCSAGFYGAAYATDQDGERAQCGQSVQRSSDNDDSDESEDSKDSRDDSHHDSDESAGRTVRYAPRSCGGRGGEPGVNSAHCGSRLTPSGSGPVKNCQSPPAQRGADG